MIKMTPEKFAQFVYDSWDMVPDEFRAKYNLAPGSCIDGDVMEQAVLQGAIPTEED